MSQEKRSVSNVNCCVYGCHSKARKNLGVRFHAFPKSGERKVYIENKFGQKEQVDKRIAWIKKIKTGKAVSKHMKICSLHFTREDYILPNVPSKVKRLKTNAVPSQNLPKHVPPSLLSVERRRRLKNRKQKEDYCIASAVTLPSTSKLSEAYENENIQYTENERIAAESLLALAIVEKVDKSIQVNSDNILQPFILLLDTDEKLNTLTGLPSINMLNSLVSLFEKLYPDLKVHKLNSKERIISTFVKMKQNISFRVLTILFKYVSPTTCKNIFSDTVDKLASILEGCIPWPTKDEILSNMPLCFESMTDVRIVFDCTEIFMQKPKCLCCRLKSYSHYKGHNTIKFLAGASPGGLITYASKAYGGRTSDNIIFQQSDIIKKLLPGIDAIMVDKGFRIEDITAMYNIKMIRPPFLKQGMFSEEEALLNRKIARARVHIERVFQRVKIFEILKNPITWNILPNIDNIFIIACGITNLCTPILTDDKYIQ